MKNGNPAHITFGFTGIQNSVAGFSTNADLLAQIPLPSAIDPKDVGKICQDCDLFAATLRKSPQMFSKLIEALNHGKPQEAGTIAREMGLSEEQFARKGGGLYWLLIAAIVVAGVLYAKDAW
jgi:hypothetical protein